MSTLSSAEIEKYEHLKGEDMLPSDLFKGINISFICNFSLSQR